MNLEKDIIRLKEDLNGYDIPDKHDTDLKTGNTATWCEWMRKQLVEADMDFIESWYIKPDSDVYINTFYVLAINKSHMAIRIEMVFNTDDVVMAINVYRELDKSPYGFVQDKPLDPGDWSVGDLDRLNSLISDISDLLTNDKED